MQPVFGTLIKNTYDIEKIQRHAARWVLFNYSYYSVTDMLIHLKWPTLQERRHVNNLSQFHKIVHQPTPSIQLPSYILPTQFPTRVIYQLCCLDPVHDHNHNRSLHIGY